MNLPWSIRSHIMLVCLLQHIARPTYGRNVLIRFAVESLWNNPTIGSIPSLVSILGRACLLLSFAMCGTIMSSIFCAAAESTMLLFAPLSTPNYDTGSSLNTPPCIAFTLSFHCVPRNSQMFAMVVFSDSHHAKPITHSEIRISAATYPWSDGSTTVYT